MMACDNETGKIRELEEGEAVDKGKETLFKVGEVFEIRGVEFSIVGIEADPSNTILFKPVKAAEAEDKNTGEDKNAEKKEGE